MKELGIIIAGIFAVVAGFIVFVYVGASDAAYQTSNATTPIGNSTMSMVTTLMGMSDMLPIIVGCGIILVILCAIWVVVVRR